MRFPKTPLAPNTVRSVTKFLWLPTIKLFPMGTAGSVYQRRWLEFATWGQMYNYNGEWENLGYWL